MSNKGEIKAEGLAGRCGTCAHWTRYENAFEVSCYGKHAGTCESKGFIYEGGSRTPEDGLRYWDYEGYSAGFDTGENFGCIHWLKRES